MHAFTRIGPGNNQRRNAGCHWKLSHGDEYAMKSLAHAPCSRTAPWRRCLCPVVRRFNSCPLFLETRDIATTTAAASLCARSKSALQTRENLGRIVCHPLEDPADLSNGLFLHWPAQLFLKSRFLELAMRLQPIGHAGPEWRPLQMGTRRWNTPAVVKNQRPQPTLNPRSRAQTLQQDDVEPRPCSFPRQRPAATTPHSDTAHSITRQRNISLAATLDGRFRQAQVGPNAAAPEKVPSLLVPFIKWLYSDARSLTDANKAEPSRQCGIGQWRIQGEKEGREIPCWLEWSPGA